MPCRAGGMPALTGYLSPGYADSLSEFGVPRLLPLSGGWILDRAIPGSSRRDATGCYPLFTCADWSKLKTDVEGLAEDLVSLCLVADPFGDYAIRDLERSFDVVLPYKEHLVADLALPPASFVSRHHQKGAAQASRKVQVERCQGPPAFLDEWVGLYAVLRARHNIAGMAAFSRRAFEKQLAVPGLVMFRACSQNEAVGIHLWFVEREVAYFHLAATNAEGYRLGASYALLWQALESLRREVRWLDLGAGPDRTGRTAAGLQQWKAGWSTGTRAAPLCGKILQPAAYRLLVEARHASTAEYFPAYRAPAVGALPDGFQGNLG
jgi:hypothetical protein